ncbi:hypothetical protein VTK56DRAFT_3705 [Thermocarpiscus australiensis]
MGLDSSPSSRSRPDAFLAPAVLQRSPPLLLVTHADCPIRHLTQSRLCQSGAGPVTWLHNRGSCRSPAVPQAGDEIFMASSSQQVLAKSRRLVRQKGRLKHPASDNRPRQKAPHLAPLGPTLFGFVIPAINHRDRCTAYCGTGSSLGQVSAENPWRGSNSPVFRLL